MKKVILFLLLMPFPAFAQVIENFESGTSDKWIQNLPARWKPDTLSALSGEFSFHHVYDNPEAGNDQAAIETKNLHPDETVTKWSFTLRHGYDPSSTNNWMVFLMSESSPGNMLAGNKGFAIGVNINGSDDSLRLVKFSGQDIKPVMSFGLNWQSSVGSSVAVKISAERSAAGDWKGEVHKMTGELIGSGTASDYDLYQPAFFGIVYRYSSAKDRLLWIDDVQIDGLFYEDHESPAVDTCVITGRNSLDLIFSEAPAPGSVRMGDFIINNSDTAACLQLLTPSHFSMVFPGVFRNKAVNTLMVNNICDKYANCTDAAEVQFTPVWAETGDVVITEVMADPVTPVALPAVEYVELTNRTDFAINLNKWILEDESQCYVLPAAVIHPYQKVILVKQSDAESYQKYGNIIALKSFPSFSDAGELVLLKDSTGTLIHGVKYSKEWYGNDLKSEGGWSLEMIDYDFPFYYSGNWSASTSRDGGTPGSDNSVKRSNHDLTFEGLQNAFPEDSLHILLSFSEPLFGNEDLLGKTTIDGKASGRIIPADPLNESFRMILNEPLENGLIIEVEAAADLRDFAGNLIEKRKFITGLPEACARGDVLFNELLFNPLPGEADFIELFNNSGKSVDASRLYLVSVNDDTGDTSVLYRVSTVSRCILPHSYYAFTEDEVKLDERYISGSKEFIFESSDMPSLPDDEGHLLLLNRELDIIDEIYYKEEMHNSLLSGFEGISLEKISPGLSSIEPSVWHSASEISGWGTPGAVNSIFSEVAEIDDRITLSSSRITPDSDGFEDALTIHLNFNVNGNVVSASIFNESGSLVRKIASNLLSGPQGVLYWDGSADDGTPVHNGIYIVLITYYNESGQTGKWKKVCAVIR